MSTRATPEPAHAGEQNGSRLPPLLQCVPVGAAAAANKEPQSVQERRPPRTPGPAYLMMLLPNHSVEMRAALPSAFIASIACCSLASSAVSSLRVPTPYSSVPKWSSSTA